MLICEVRCGRGAVRPENQDNFYLNGIWRDGSDSGKVSAAARILDGLFAVCDGMGGESCGDEASLLAASALDGMTPEAFSLEGPGRLQEVNLELCRRMRLRRVRIGTTFAGLWIAGGRAGILNIGDSRIYLLRNRMLKRLSRDHTQTQRLLDMGMITPGQASSHPGRHKLTQHLGIFPEEMVIEPYAPPPFALEKGDLFLLCSDGLTDMLTEEEITSLLSQRNRTGEKADRLYQAAMDGGGRDNITVMLIQNIA